MDRTYVYDAIALLGSYLAMCSHLKEHIVHYKQEIQTAKDQETIEDINNKLTQLDLIYSLAIWERRRIMKKLETALDYDEKMHCLFKHAIEALNYSIEVEDATNDLWDLSTTATDILNALLSYATGNELTFCSRCLWDLLLSDNNNNNGMSSM